MTASLRNLLAASILLLSPAWATNPAGSTDSSSCSPCFTSCPTDGQASGGVFLPQLASFDWSINVGLVRYPKPSTFIDLAQTAYEQDGNLPNFEEMVNRYFPSNPLQQAQLQLKISQTQISAATFHPSCLYLQSEANYIVVKAKDVNGFEYITEILTDDSFTLIEPLDYAHPANGFRVRVWKRDAAPLNLMHDSSYFGGTILTPYYDAQPFGSPSVTPLTDVTFQRPTGATDSDTLIYIQNESTGNAGTRTTTKQIVQTLDTNGLPLTEVSSVYKGSGTSGSLLMQETVTYSARGTKAWDYTLTRQVLTAPVDGSGTLGTPVLTKSTQEVYQDFSTSAAGGDPGMKRLMSRTDAFSVSGGVAITDGSSPQTTTYTYVNDSTNPVVYGRMQSVTNPDGSWKSYNYVASTASPIVIITEYSGWQNVPASDTADALQKVTTVNGSSFTVVTTVGGQTLSSSQTTLNVGVTLTTLTTQQSDGTAQHTTTIGYFSDDASAPNTGRVAWIENSDGTASTYVYSNISNYLTSTVRSGAGNRNGITDGTQTVTTLGVGSIPLGESKTDILTGITFAHWVTDNDVTDTIGRPIQRDYLINTTPGADYDVSVYSCCGLSYFRDRDGSVTNYYRDGLKRVYQETKQASPVAPLITTYISTSGLTTSKTRTVGSASQFLGSSAKSLDGQKVTETGPSLMSNSSGDRPTTTTVTVHSSTGDTVTRTYADSSTSIASYYLDGRLSSVSGSAVAPKSYSYGTWSGGATTTTNASGVTSTIEKDWLGRTIHAISSATGTTDYTYYSTASPAIPGSWGKLNTVTDADNVVTTYGYNTKGQQTTTSRTVPTGSSTATEVTSVVNDVVSDVTLQGVSLGVSLRKTRSVASTGIDQITTSQSYASGDGLKAGTLSLGRQTATVATYPDSGGVATMTTIAPDGTRTVATITNGLLTQTAKYTRDSTPVLISSTSYTYDALQHPATSVDSRTGTTTYSNLTESGRPLTVTTPHGDATGYTCNIMGRVLATTLPDSSVTYTTYYPTGKVKAQWGSQTNPTWYEYDAQNRLHILRTWQADPSLTQAMTSPPSGFALTTWTYGATTGLLTSKTDNADKSTNYAYTPAGRLYTRTWARGVVTTYGYTNGYLTSVTYTGEGSSYTTPNLAYAYDAFGRVSQVKRGGVLQNSYTYRNDYFQIDTETQQIDSLNKTITHTYEDGTSGTVTGRPKGYTFSDGSSTWAYDSAGRPSTVTDGTDTFTYGYSYQVIPATTSPTAPAYDQGTTATGSVVYNSNIPFTLQGPKVNTTLSYEATRDVLYSRENDLSSGDLSKFTYTVNSISQRTAVATTGSAFGTAPADWGWYYDALGQVTSANSPTAANNRAYTYDTIGNRITATANTDVTSYFGNSAGTQTGANALNQYAKITYPASTTISPVHDDDGNMTSGPVAGTAGMSPGMPTPTNATLLWDAENRLVKATVGTSVVTYDYDYQSRLISSTQGTTVTQYLYEGWNRIAEYNVTTTGSSSSYALTKTYLWGLDLSGTTQGAGGVGGLLSVVDAVAITHYYPTYDGNGNVSEYINQNGTMAAHFEYDPFGNLTVDANNNASSFPCRFSTKPQDAVTGLLYFGYRWYSPLDGRWLRRDPRGEAGGVNLYGCVLNNPLRFIDPLGLNYMFLNDSTAVNIAGIDNGHAASIVGNPDTGYDYYSKDGQDDKGNDINTHEHFDTMDDFWDSDDVSRRYDRGTDIPTTPGQDDAMRKYADKHLNDKYSGISNNCGDYDNGIMGAGDIPPANDTWFWVTRPNSQYNDLSNRAGVNNFSQIR